MIDCIRSEKLIDGLCWLLPTVLCLSHSRVQYLVVFAKRWRRLGHIPPSAPQIAVAHGRLLHGPRLFHALRGKTMAAAEEDVHVCSKGKGEEEDAGERYETGVR